MTRQETRLKALIANIILAFATALSDQGEARAYSPSRLIAACDCDYQVSQGVRRNELRSTPRMCDQMDGEIAGDSDTKSDARGCTPPGIKHSPFPSQVRPLRGGRHSHNGLCLPGLGRDRPSVPTSPRPACVPLAQRPPKSVTTLSRMLRYPARRGRLPRGAEMGQDSCHQHFRITRCAGLTPWPTHTWPAETSQYKLRRTPAIPFGLRGPYHRTTGLCCGVAMLLPIPLIIQRLPLNVTTSPQLAEQHCPVRRSRQDDRVFSGRELRNIDSALVAR